MKLKKIWIGLIILTIIFSIFIIIPGPEPEERETKAYLQSVFHRCDSITDWVASECVLDLTWITKVEGQYSIQMTSDANAFAYMEYFRTVDWSKFQELIFWVKHPGYTNETGRIYVCTDIGNYKHWDFDFSEDWSKVNIDLSSAGDSSMGTLDLSDITYIRVAKWSNEDPGELYYFDFFHGRTIDITSDIIDCKIVEELYEPSYANLKIKGDSLAHFQSGLEIEIYDEDDVLSWTGRILYPESVLEGTTVVGKLKALGSNSQFNNAYRKNFTTVRDSDYIIKNVIDNGLAKFSYDDEIDNFTLTYKYDLKNKIQKMFKYLAMLERAVIHYLPDGEIFFNKYNNLTASGMSWDQDTSNIKITGYTPTANRHITRTLVIGANNDLGQVYYVGKGTDAAVQKYGINELQPWRDSEISNYTEAKQIGDNLLAIYSMDTQMISLLTVGKKHVQVGYTIELAWTGVFSITQNDFLLTKRTWYPTNDISELELTDNILTKKAFNVRVINKFYDEDAQQSFDEPDVSESTIDGTVEVLHSIAQLRSPSYLNALITPIEYPIIMTGGDGFVETAGGYRDMLLVLFSDVNASINASFFVKNGGDFKVRIIHSGSGANAAKTVGGNLYVSNDVKDGAETWDVGPEVFDFVANNANIVDWDDNTNAITIADNSSVGIYWTKDDNAGGAAGNLHIYGIILVRQ